ncbi:uncharacterized protein LOC130621601 isoform X1 [Hydractinia symbiolongicarpus]|uniref:uncharacterized protein LOC130621601 isoform X1 n=1 Tax=Hydractinia symbiolongicarpus TaxID=13093 RepID=UPI0025512B32|nr:uncharacterized protein LOC130621601 isoform X1 [Hydractinia symbiolongicarpus]
MVLLVRDKVPYLGLKSRKLIKTNEELRYDYGDKCMLSLRKQKNLCVPLHLKDIENQLKKISHASILKLKEGQKTVIEVEVLKEPYMIIRDREKPQDVADDGFCECCKIRYTSLQHVYVCYDPFFSCRSNLFLGYKNYIDGKIKMIVF